MEHAPNLPAGPSVVAPDASGRPSWTSSTTASSWLGPDPARTGYGDIHTHAEADIRPAFFHPLHVRYADTDAQGHVFFANYLTYADEGLTWWLHHIGLPYARLEELGLDFVFADARCTYRGRARFNELLHIHCGPERVGRTSLTHRFEVVRASDDTLLAEGTLVQVCVGRPEGRPSPLPDELRAAITASEGARS